ncbi:MAG: cbb3-type cytochrome c oxidase subunit 3 [Pseudomonadota bacterium]
MDTYTLLREFADSWMLLAMFLIFVGIVLFTFRPGARAKHAEISMIPLRDVEPDETTCAGNCAACACGGGAFDLRGGDPKRDAK